MNAFVTGGSRGIGRAIVLKYVKEGWNCAFTYVGNEAAANETIEKAKVVNSESRVVAYKLDVKSASQVEQVVEQVITDFEDITAVVNNAAVVRNNAAVMMSNEEWEEVIAADLSGPFYIIRRSKISAHATGS